jgi:hypothetical protein
LGHFSPPSGSFSFETLLSISGGLLLQIPNKKPSAGWFVTIPPELKAKFKAAYPHRRQMRKLTMLAIQWAIKKRPVL